MDKTQAMERTFLLASHCTPEENEGHGGPKVRQLHLGAEAEASVRSPTPQGRVLTTQCCLVYCAWETDPGDRPPKGYNFSLWNNPLLPRASDFPLYLFLLCPVAGEGFAAHPACWVRGLWTHTGVTSGALISEQLEWGARRQGGETGQPV